MKAWIVFLATLAGASAVCAQEAYVDDGDVYYAPAPYEARADYDIPEDPNAARVYGWTSAPADCGTFKYWNGDYCADARFEPPRTEQ